MNKIGLVASALRGNAYRFSSEMELHQGIQMALEQASLPVSAEVRLSRRDVIDFMVGDIGIEAKVSGSPAAILRQLMRYAQSPLVAGLILVTRKVQHAHRFPAAIAGKAIEVVTLESSAL